MGHINAVSAAKLKAKYGLKYFVETGTGSGTNLVLALKLQFDELHSCEIDDLTHRRCRVTFYYCDEVKLYHGDSVSFFHRLLSRLDNKPCLFFLDAHYPGEHSSEYEFDYTQEEDENRKLPLKDELSLILKYRKNCKDVIIVDDARVYLSGNFGLEVSKIRQASDEYFKEFIEVLRQMSDTHIMQVMNEDQGYLIFLPK